MTSKQTRLRRYVKGMISDLISTTLSAGLDVESYVEGEEWTVEELREELLRQAQIFWGQSFDAEAGQFLGIKMPKRSR